MRGLRDADLKSTPLETRKITPYKWVHPDEER
jgi:hypothetical protein